MDELVIGFAFLILIAGFSVLIYLAFEKIRLDERRNTLLSNLDSLNEIKQAVRDAANALKDLAAKSAGGQDISAELSATATALEAAVTASGEPTGTPEEAPTA